MNLRKWVTLERLVPSSTILLAFLAEALDMLGVVQLSIGEQITLALIGLVAVDALTERLTVLEQIRNDVKETIARRARSNDFLQARIKLPPMDQRLVGAKTLDIAGMSLLGVSTQYSDLLAQKAKDGCRIRLLLMNHENAALVEATSAFVSPLSSQAHAQEIVTSLNTLTSDPILSQSEFVVALQNSVE